MDDNLQNKGEKVKASQKVNQHEKNSWNFGFNEIFTLIGIFINGILAYYAFRAYDASNQTLNSQKAQFDYMKTQDSTTAVSDAQKNAEIFKLTKAQIEAMHIQNSELKANYQLERLAQQPKIIIEDLGYHIINNDSYQLSGNFSNKGRESILKTITVSYIDSNLKLLDCVSQVSNFSIYNDAMMEYAFNQGAIKDIPNFNKNYLIFEYTYRDIINNKIKYKMEIFHFIIKYSNGLPLIKAKGNDKYYPFISCDEATETKIKKILFLQKKSVKCRN